MKKITSMGIYSSSTDAISDLHRQGFTYDFQLAGKELFCVQENFFIKTEEFAISKYYKIKPSKKMARIVVFAIIALHYNIKGILLTRFAEHPDNTLPVFGERIMN
jgi:hypothetical protein